MAYPGFKTLNAINKAVDLLESGSSYQWGHMGSCNCGHLAQALSEFSKEEIHQLAMQGTGDWSEQVSAYCDTTGLPLDAVISELVQAGFSLQDLINLERLKDPEVLSLIPIDQRNRLRHNQKSDVIYYLNLG